MIEVDTFLTTLYVMVDDFCQQYADEPTRHPGPLASLSPSEVITLAIFGQKVIHGLRNEITVSELHYVDDRHKPFQHYCQFACSDFRVVPRQKDDNSSKAGQSQFTGKCISLRNPWERRVLYQSKKNQERKDKHKHHQEQQVGRLLESSTNSQHTITGISRVA